MSNRVRWAPRVPMEWLQRLYESDAKGIVDDELIDKVGERLYERCRDCVLVVDSIHGKWTCPECREPCTRTGERDVGLIECSSCGWTCDAKAFRLSWRHKELLVDTTFVVQFIDQWQRARTHREKMLAIDGVIHRWHHETKIAERGGVGRPVGVNLIEGSRKQVIAFLDRLSAGPSHDRWATLHEGHKTRVREGRTR
jgi:hypothetical protein